MVGLIY